MEKLRHTEPLKIVQKNTENHHELAGVACLKANTRQRREQEKRHGIT